MVVHMIEDGYTGRDEDLTRTQLKHSLVLGKDSGLVLLEKIHQVKEKVEGENKFYPPKFAAFPTVTHQEGKFESLPTSPWTSRVGRISHAEAAAFAILAEESNMLDLLAMPDPAVDLNSQLNRALGIPDNDDLQQETILGISQFGFFAGIAAGTRAVLLSREPYPENPTTLSQISKKIWLDHFSRPIRKDGYTIGTNTTDAVVGFLDSFTENTILRQKREEPKTLTVARLMSRKHGVRLGRNLYEEALSFTAQFLPSKVT